MRKILAYSVFVVPVIIYFLLLIFLPMPYNIPFILSGLIFAAVVLYVGFIFLAVWALEEIKK